jgi:hypothetical protein
VLGHRRLADDGQERDDVEAPAGELLPAPGEPGGLLLV